MFGLKGGLLVVAVLALALPAGAHAQVLVSEVQAGGASTSDEFVELVNVGAPASLEGALLSFAGLDCEAAPPPFELPAVTLGTGQHLLVGGTDYRGVDLPDASFSQADRLPADLGSVAFIPPPSAPIFEDVLGYGPIGEGLSLPCAEGSPYPSAPPAGNSLERVQDTNDNASDFVLRSVPNPENLSGAQRAAPTTTPPTPPPPTAGPPQQSQPQIFDGPQIMAVRMEGRLVAGEPVVLFVAAQDPGLPTAGISVNFGDGRATGLDACRLGRQSGPFIHGATTEFEVPHTFDEPGTYQLVVTVSSGGCYKNGRSTMFLLTVVIEPGGSASIASASSRGPALYGAQRRVPRACRGATSRVTPRSLRRSQATIICLINDLRRTVNRRLRPLRRSTRLTRSALAHSRDMVRRRYFAHVGPGGPNLLDRLKRARYRSKASGENIAVLAVPTAVELLNAWIESPPHYANLISSLYRFAGVGIVPRAAPPGFPRGVPAATFTLNLGRNR